jgi:sulfide:quinone oxidoreductase
MHYQVIIVGAGTGGIMTACQLLKKDKSLSIAIIDPAETHYYQPAFTLVGAGAFNMENTHKPTKELIPNGAKWIKEFVDAVDPETKRVTISSGEELSYDYLVLSPGLVNNLDSIEGLRDAIEKKVACSNYIDPTLTWKLLQDFKGGNAIFTMPTTPIKCGGAPQKAAYLAADFLKDKKFDKPTNIIYATPGSVVFGVPEVRKTLETVINRYGIKFKPSYAPIKIDAANKVVTFKMINQTDNACIINTDDSIGEEIKGDSIIEIPFDFLHLAPPEEAPAFIKNSVLANEAGWIDLDINTLQHNRFPAIFGIGDAAALPTAKTGAAIRKQVPIIVNHILQMIKNGSISNDRYYGYSSCPLVTGYGKMVLAEFNYKNEFTPDPKLKQLFIKDSSKEHWRLWMLKKYLLPYLYWNKMMKGENV